MKWKRRQEGHCPEEPRKECAQWLHPGGGKCVRILVHACAWGTYQPHGHFASLGIAGASWSWIAAVVAVPKQVKNHWVVRVPLINKDQGCVIPDGKVQGTGGVAVAGLRSQNLFQDRLH